MAIKKLLKQHKSIYWQDVSKRCNDKSVPWQLREKEVRIIINAFLFLEINCSGRSGV